MRIHRIHGRDLEEALRLARQKFGAGALVLGREQDGEGVAVSVCEVTPKRFVAHEEPPPLSPSLREVADLLARHGASPAFVSRVLSGIDPGRLELEHAIDLAAEIIAAEVRIARSPRTPGRLHVTAFVGPSGGGKTSTLIKLAAKMQAAGRRVAIASLDAERLGAHERLAAFSERLRLPTILVREPAELTTLFALPQAPEICLLDGSGDLAADRAVLDRLAGIDARLVLDACVVLPASLSTPALVATLTAHRPLSPAGCVVTKIDETPEPAAAVEVALDSALPLAFLADGREVDRSLHRATPDRVADVFLRGRIA